MVDYFFLVTMLLDNKSYTPGKPVYPPPPLNGVITSVNCHTHLQQSATSSSCWSPAWSHCCGVASHSSTSICHKSANVLGHSGINSTPKLLPRMFSRVEVRTVGRSFHLLHSQTLEAASGKPRSVGTSVVILEDSIWPNTTETISLQYWAK